MWVFYQSVTAGPFQFSEEAATLVGLALLTGIFVILPSYLERRSRQKESCEK